MSRAEIHQSPLPAPSSERERAAEAILPYPKSGGYQSEAGLWDGDSINIRPLVQTIVANKRIIAISAGVGLLLAALISLVQPPVYEGRSVVDVEGVNENFLNMREVDPTADAGNYTVEPFLQTQVQELQSNSLLEEVATKLDLKNRPSYKGRFNRIKKWLGLPTEEVTAQQLAREMTSHLKVRLSGETRLVEILYSDHDPQLAAQVSNTLAQTFIKDTLSRRQQISRAVEQGLADQLGALKKNLEDSENQLQAYTQQVGLLFTSNNNSAAQEEFLKLQDALVRAQEERIEVESRYRTAASAPQESIPDVLRDDTLREYSVRMADLSRQLAKLSETLTPAHYKVREVEAQIASLQAAMDRERNATIRSIENEYQAAKSREELLEKQHSHQASVVAEESAHQVRFKLLKGEVESNRDLYDSMLDRVKQVSVSSSIVASNLQIIDSAEAPDNATWPNPPLYLAIGAFTGALVGMAYTLYRAGTSNCFAIPGELGSHLGLPELGAIPQLVMNNRLMKKQLPIASVRESPIQLVSWQEKGSPAGETFRTALLSLLFSGESGNRPQVVVISSVTANEGKTTVASNFAIELALINCQVLLVDGDLKRPRLHEVFGVTNASGFSDLLRSDRPTDSYSRLELGYPTHVPNLYVLPSGPTSGAASSFLYSNRTADLLNQCRRQFDIVIIDTAPLLAAADTRMLAKLADGLALVVRADATSRQVAFAVLRRVSEDGTRILGTILNAWNPRNASNTEYSEQYELLNKEQAG